MRSQFTVPGYTAIDFQEHWVKKLLHEANNGTTTKWSPIQSVIIQVINKIRWFPICWSWVWLLIELDDMQSCYQLMKTMTKFEKETRHQLFVFIKKYQQLTR